MNVLLVDDEKLVLMELERLVADKLPKANKYAFNKASEAIAFAESNKIDIAFLDINMRVMDGITMAKKLQEFNPTVNIIFCTGYTEYALDALELNCSGYILKPATPEKLQTALEHLRFPLEIQAERRITVRCFGNFEVYCDGQPLRFKYSKSLEMFAYLVDRNGARCSTNEIAAVLFGDEEHRSYFNRIRLDLIAGFAEVGAEEVIIQSKGYLSIDRSKISCDYFDLLDGKIAVYNGEYMTQFSFAEETHASLEMMTNPIY